MVMNMQALLGAVLLSISASTGLAQTLATSTSGGTTEKAMFQYVYDPLTARTGIKVTGVSLVSEEAFARMIAEEKNPSLDMYQFTGGQELTAKKRGLTQDIGDLGGVKLAPMFRDPDNQWVAIGVVTSGIVYNTKYIKTPPTSITDLFKPEYKGKVGLPNFTNVKGTDFLVLLAKAFGGSEHNVAPGMEKMKELVQNGAQFYATAAQMKTLFAQEEMWITFYDASNALSAKNDGLPVAFAAPKEGMSVQFFTLAIAKNSKNAASARQAIAAALRPEAQAKLAEVLGWSVVNPETKVPDSMKDAVLADEKVLNKFIMLDRDAIAEKKAEWVAEFNRMVSR
jgi:putative spermidine/putrescine transport system substrate-binding protein